jgi:hypothetical protein
MGGVQNMDQISKQLRQMGRPQAQPVPCRPDPDQYLDLDTLPPEVLIDLRDEIDSRLPPAKLEGMNLEQELINQYQRVLQLQNRVLFSDDVQANQKAQVAGQVASTLQQLVKMQNEFYTAERYKILEGRMLEAIKLMPKEAAEVFVAAYAGMERKSG